MPVARTTAKRIAPVWQRQNPKRRPRDPGGRLEGNFNSRGRRRINAGRPHWFCRGLPQTQKFLIMFPSDLSAYAASRVNGKSRSSSYSQRGHKNDRRSRSPAMSSSFVCHKGHWQIGHDGRTIFNDARIASTCSLMIGSARSPYPTTSCSESRSASVRHRTLELVFRRLVWKRQHETVRILLP